MLDGKSEDAPNVIQQKKLRQQEYAKKEAEELWKKRGFVVEKDGSIHLPR